ncbi:MAG: GreA/GreB family elongation factor [Pseudomonadota bacterium]
MSVAFRRESDEEHKEPKFELPLPPGPNLVTARGRAMIDARVTALGVAIEQERDDAAREVLKRELRYWNTRQTTAILAPLPDGDEVAFGTRVTFRMNGKERQIDIVGSDEADPAAGKIAFTAPLAHAMIGAVAGEQLDYNGVLDAIEIVAVARPEGEPEA